MEEPQPLYNQHWEERETAELLCFIRLASQELKRRQVNPKPPERPVRITRTLRIYIGEQELKLRPMAKSVLLLFLYHPEGIALKSIADHREELSRIYRRVCRSDSPEAIEQRMHKMLDYFNNELNVNIARVNRAISPLVDDNNAYYIEGQPGQPKRIALERKWVVWE